MAIDSTKSFEVSEDGLTIDSGTGIWIGGGDSAPSHNSPEGSRYFRTSPEEEYIQEGPGNANNWVLFEGGGGDGKATCEDFTQTAHGFVVGDVLRFSSTWQKAQADTAANSEALGVVSAVPNANDFTICYSGRVDGLSGLTANEVHFLSDVTAGALVTTSPVISKPMLFATSTTSAVVYNMRALDTDENSGSAIEVQDEGIQLTVNAKKFNFVGDNVTVTEPVADELLVTISGGAEGDPVATVQARRTTAKNDLTTSFQDITFDATDTETDAATVEHNNTNTDRIDIKEDGTYQIALHGCAHVDGATEYMLDWRVRKNDTTIIPGTECGIEVEEDTGGTIASLVVVDLLAGDFLSAQFKSGVANDPDINAGLTFVVTKLPSDGAQGATGPQGATGSGSNVTVKDEGTSVTGTPHANLNFTGSGVTVTDEGGGQAKIDIPAGGVFGSEYEYAESEAMTSTTSTSFVTKLSHTTAALPAGDYRIGYTWKPGVDTNGVLGEYEVKVGATVISNPDFEADNDHHQWAGFKRMNLSGAQTIVINYKSGNGVAATQMSHARIEIWRVN